MSKALSLSLEANTHVQLPRVRALQGRDMCWCHHGPLLKKDCEVSYGFEAALSAAVVTSGTVPLSQGFDLPQGAHELLELAPNSPNLLVH